MKTRDDLTPREKAAQVLFELIARNVRDLEEGSLDWYVHIDPYSDKPHAQETPAVTAEIYRQIRRLGGAMLLNLERIAGLDHPYPIDDWRTTGK